jgi:hypothetical protein
MSVARYLMNFPRRRFNTLFARSWGNPQRPHSVAKLLFVVFSQLIYFALLRRFQENKQSDKELAVYCVEDKGKNSLLYYKL